MTSTGLADDHFIDVRDVWKIFGAREHEALAAMRREGLSKAQVLQRFDCVVAVQGASFSVARGEVFCVLGLSGSGKSTLLRHINRLLEPTSGSVWVDGEEVTALSEAQLRPLRNRRLAMVFQDFGLMPHRSVIDNVAMPLEVRGVPRKERLAAAVTALNQVALAGWGARFAHELSGGMRQRVGLARAIAADTDILLMDEPFSALDPLIKRQLQDEFKALAATLKKTTVFITHDLEEAVRVGQRMAIVHDGAVAQIGTAQELMLAPASAHVAAFVSGLSPLNVLQASAVMQPLAEHELAHGAVPANALQVADTTLLARLVEHAAHSDAPIVVVDGQGKRVGVVTRNALLERMVPRA